MKCNYPNCFECQLKDCNKNFVTDYDIKQQNKLDRIAVDDLKNPDKATMQRRKRQAHYEQTDKARERQKRYEQSEKAKERQRRYRSSPKGREVERLKNLRRKARKEQQNADLFPQIE
jgi:hypothetical protein